MAAGKTPSAVTPYLCGGNLFAALKKSGGHRPIAVGETLRRLTAKCVTRKATADAKESLAPNQLGVGVKGGAEAIIHAVNAVFHDNNIADKDKWILQVDFSNAFNGISREEMQNRIREHCPKAAAWTESCYSSASHLFFSQTKICSSTGSQQGDPEASLLFSLVLLPLIKRIQEECPNLLLLLFYLDDGTLVGRRADLQKAIDVIQNEGSRLGLTLNPGKSLVWCGSTPALEFNKDDPLDRNVPCAPLEGFSLLGAPIGNIPFCRDVINERILKISSILDLLPSINNAQVEFSLLRYCYSFSKFAYCLRNFLLEHVVVCYERFDGLQEQAFTQIMGRPLNDAGKQQALLPVKKGGAGLRSAKQHCSAAFIASVAQTRAIVDSLLPQNVQRRSLDSAFLVLQQATGNATYTDLSLLPPEFSQHSLSLEIDNFNFTNLLTSSDDRNRARLRSLALPHAGDWVDAIPSPSLNLNLDSRSFGAVMGYRLGLSLMQEYKILTRILSSLALSYR